jgi:uroporphyrinogen-III synthase
MKKVFITRTLSEDSPFRKMLKAAGCLVVGQSLLRFEPLSFSVVPPCDWLFFYSPRAVSFFAAGLATAGLAWPAAPRVAALGPGTALALEAEGKKTDFTGDGDPERVAERFRPLCQGETVLFPRAKNSRHSVRRRLGEDIDALDLLVYENQPGDNIPGEDYDIWVFTSPMNVQAFFSAPARLAPRRAVAIGASTAEALRRHGVREALLPKRPSEEALARRVLELLNQEKKP